MILIPELPAVPSRHGIAPTSDEASGVIMCWMCELDITHLNVRPIPLTYWCCNLAYNWGCNFRDNPGIKSRKKNTQNNRSQVSILLNHVILYNIPFPHNRQWLVTVHQPLGSVNYWGLLSTIWSLRDHLKDRTCDMAGRMVEFSGRRRERIQTCGPPEKIMTGFLSDTSSVLYH